MNFRTGFYILLTALGLMGLFSCLGSNNIEYEISTDAQLTSFALSHDSLPALATTKFSIDQAQSFIYNYDSLPYLTDTVKIGSTAIVNYTAGSGAYPSIRIEHFDNENDTAWIANGDSLRFAHTFELKLYAPSGASKTYTVRINIHQIDPDSIQYSPATNVPVITAPDWADLTRNCPHTMVTCLGFLRPDEEKDLTLIVKDNNNDFRFAFTKDTIDYQLGEKIPEGFPVEEFTIFNNRDFAGRLTIISNLQSVWATDDGLYWTNLFGTVAELPIIEGGNAFFYNDEIWFLNGRIKNGEYNSKIYFSTNGGVVWREKSEKMQPPAHFPLRQDAKVTVDSDGKYFYIEGGRNQTGALGDKWKVALNSNLF